MDDNHSWIQMVGDVSHQLKTPLTSAKGYLDVLHHGDDELTPQQEKWVGRAEDALDRMQQIITDWLEMAWLESGQPLELNPCDLQRLIQHSVEVMEDAAERRKVTVHSEIDAEIGTIQADERKLEQVLLNLISNAIKYNKPNGEVWVTAKALPTSVEVRVRDTGKGIALEEQPRVFDRFFRSPHERIEGTGLGLSIVKGLVEKHGGSVWVESIVGEGSTFGFSLPRTGLHGEGRDEEGEAKREAPMTSVEEAESTDFDRETHSDEILDAVDDNLQEPPQMYVDQDEPDVAQQP